MAGLWVDDGPESKSGVGQHGSSPGYRHGIALADRENERDPIQTIEGRTPAVVADEPVHRAGVGSPGVLDG